MVLLFVVCGWREEAVAGVFLRTYLVHSTYVLICTGATISVFIVKPTVWYPPMNDVFALLYDIPFPGGTKI